MKWMLARLAWRFLIARKIRAFFAIMGISLGVLLLVSSQTMMSTLQHSTEVSARERFGDFDLIAGYNKGQRLLSSKDITWINNLEGVQETTPILLPYTAGHMPENVAVQPFYYSFKADRLAAEHELLSLQTGSFPEDAQVLISSKYAKEAGLGIGSTLTLPFPPAEDQTVTVSGILKESESLSRLFIFNYDWISKLTDHTGQASALILKLDNGNVKSEVIEQLNDHFDGLTIDRRSAKEEEQKNLGGLRPLVTGLSVIVLLGSILIVISTLQMSVQERQKELAVLRLLGGTRRQLFEMVIWEALWISILSSFIGSAGGIMLCYATSGLLEKWMGYRVDSVVVSYPVIAAVMLGSILVTLFASFIPAYSSSRMSPLAAHRQQPARLTQHSLWKHIVVYSLFVGLIALSILIPGSKETSKTAVIIVGVLFVLLCFLCISFLLKPLIKGIALCLKPLYAMEGTIAGRNALSRIGRSKQITRVIMLSVIVGFVGFSVLDSIVKETEKNMANQFPLDYIIQSAEASYEPGFSPELSNQLNRLKGIDSITISSSLLVDIPVNQMSPDWNGSVFKIDNKDHVLASLQSMDLIKAQQFSSYQVVEGKIQDLQKNQIVVTKDFCRYFGYSIGDTLELKMDEVSEAAGAAPLQMNIVGVIDQNPLFPGDEMTMYTSVDAVNSYREAKVEQILFNITDKNQQEAIKAQVQSLLEQPEYQNTVFYDRMAELETFYQQYKQRTAFLTASILLLTLIILAGLMNIMSSNLRESQKEFATMRSIGSKPWQVIRLAWFEGIMIAVSGTVMGLIAGVLLRYQFLSALDAQSPAPYGMIFIILAISPIIGIASALPSTYWLSKIQYNRD